MSHINILPVKRINAFEILSDGEGRDEGNTVSSAYMNYLPIRQWKNDVFGAM